jgi:hypothetical protein
MSDEGWEARMAARARQRAAAALQPEPDEETKALRARLREQERLWEAWLQETLTLGAATDWRRLTLPGCACAGGPLCCMRRARVAERLQHAAHIVARLLADRARGPA